MDSVLYQLEKLSQEVEKMSAIDPVAFGEIKGAVEALKQQVVDVKQRQSEMDMKLDMVLDKLSEAKGGWRVMVYVGGAFAAIGSGVTWVIEHFAGKG